MEKELMKELPNGMTLTAELNNDPNFPGIQISLKGIGSDDTDETVCFVEFNSTKPEGRELCVCVYTHSQDEPVYCAGYQDTGGKQQAK